jgi:alpha-amylase/alpha-mannosidase (GH57 family)
VHGHFYQPPRENPWLEDVELQDSAYPYHDWNERITAECYEPNTASRIMDGDWIVKIVNNYTNISFNFGPTLLDWMERKEPEVHRAVIDADKESRKKFSGHGSALAQAYNHMIMPLACKQDKQTQVIWGIRDFEHRFGRKPEGMWMPETAVDLETLAIMAEHGLSFTILAPHQSRKMRRIGTADWEETGENGIDPSRAYLVRLPAGQTFTVFFYDGPISRAVAFEKLLSSGESFANRLLAGFSDTRTWPQLLNISIDGETYGHHHRHGDMALAYALDFIAAEKPAVITNYGEFLEKHPPTHEVAIIENSSWSCIHGIERWRNDCGCNSGLHPGWNQAWRTPLRNALNWLRNTLRPKYEEHARAFLKDPWDARNGYISVVLNRAPENIERFFAEHAVRKLEQNDVVRALKLLELQRHAMLMFTSCGWFFDEISGIETVQVLQYAGRVIQLAEDLFGEAYKPEFLETLAKAKSNIEEHRDGAHIFEKFVKPSVVGLPKVGAHYAISSLFEDYDEKSRIYCYTVEKEDCQKLSAGKSRVAVGRARVISDITRESAALSYGVLQLGAHNVTGGVRYYQNEEFYQEMLRSVKETFNRGDFPEVLRLLDQHFEGMTYSLKELFRDKQRTILDKIINANLEETEADYRRIYNREAALMRYLKDLGIPQPKAFAKAAEFYLNNNLRRALEDETLDKEKVVVLLEEARLLEIPLDGEGLEYTMEANLGRIAEQMRDMPADPATIELAAAATAVVRAMPFEVDLWQVQNVYYRLLKTVYQGFKTRAERGEEDARIWIDRFASLGDGLQVRRDA